MDIQRPGEWPLLVRIKIFSFLDMNDLMRFSRLSSAWRSLILDSVEIGSLSCKEKVGHFHELRYSFNFETIENDRLLLADDLKFLRSESLLTVLRRSLKKLYIHHPLGYIEQSSKSLVSALNQLIQLEQLQLNELEFVGNTEELILPNLQCLTIPKVTRYGQLTLNTPKLTSFSTGDICMQNSGKLRNFKFEYPANIVCLDVEEYEPDLMKFPNLEILYCQTFSNKLASIHDLLVALPKLKQLQCQNVHGESVCQLLSSKCKLRRLDFNFYFCGFRIDTINDLDEYMNWKHDQFEIEWAVYGYKSMLSNPHKLSQHIRYVWEIYYYEVLVQSFDRISFASFFGRIAKMEDVEINGPVNDEPKLVEFLKACKFITNLSTEKTALSQSLFDRLPVYAQMQKKVYPRSWSE